MKLISLNIEANKHNHTVLPFLKKEKPDVICLQELLDSDFTLYKKELNMEGVFKASGYVKHPNYKNIEGNRSGIGIFAKNIINSGSVFYFGKEENVLKTFSEYLSDESNQKNHVLLWVDVKNGRGDLLRFFTTHLPVTKEGESSPFQLQVLDCMFRELDLFTEFILCGDMNAPRGNESFRRLAEKYKDNIPLEYKTSIDQKLHRVKGLMRMVDGLFTTAHYEASNVKLVDGVSDHMAIISDIKKID